MKKPVLIRVMAVAVAAASLLATAAPAQTTVQFQQGLDGYSGVLDVWVGPGIDGGASNILGSTLEIQYLDGQLGGADDKQLLIKFDSIIGNGAGQIPAGSKITDAKLIVVNGTSGNAISAGPYGVAQMLMDFDTSTTWNTVESAGYGDGTGATYSNGITAAARRQQLLQSLPPPAARPPAPTAPI